MAVLPQTPNVAAAMEHRETKRSKKRPVKVSSDSNPSEDESNSQLTNSKKKKRQPTTTAKHGPIQDEVVPDREKHTESNSISTKEVRADCLKLGVCIVPVAKRFLLLHSFLKKNLSKKVVVVCSSWQAAKFYTDLLKHIKFDSVYFHGKMDKEKKGSSSSSKFSEAESGILFTDIPVESLQVSNVDWIVLYDAPDIPQGWSSNEGNILTFLVNNELKYLDHLQEANVQVVEYTFDTKKLSKGEPQLEKLVAKNHHLYTSAVKAYRSFILAYNQRLMKDVFNVDHLDVVAAAASFCFSNPPKVVFIRNVEKLESLDVGMPGASPLIGRL